MNDRLNTPWLALRAGIGLMATLAGLDKSFDLLTNWDQYVSPLAAQLLPFSTHTFMGIVGIIELVVGLAILTRWTRLGAYVASAWLIGVALNLIAAGFFDIAVRDLILAIAAFTLARLAEVFQVATARRVATTPAASPRGITA